MITAILVGYLIYSVIGFFFMRDYSLACHEAGIFPYGGSIPKYIGYSLLCGVFTTTIILIAAVVTICSIIKHMILFLRELSAEVKKQRELAESTDENAKL
jgi:hypothetical protein